MPDLLAAIGPDRRQAAIEAVASWAGNLPSAKALTADELAPYSERKAFAGWRIEVAFPDRTRRLDVLLVDGFPRRVPRVALVDRPTFLTWPHVEEDGVLCLLGDGAEINHTEPVAVIQNQLAEAAELVEGLVSGERDGDFRDEFYSYWYREIEDRAPQVYSLLDPIPPTRLVQVWRGSAFYLLGDETGIPQWLKNRSPRGGPWNTAPAPLLWLDRPLSPSEFPRSPAELMKLAQRCGGEPLLEQLATEDTGELVVVLAAASNNGPCLAAVSITPRTDGYEQSGLGNSIPGFRPGKAPRRLVSQRLFGGGRIQHLMVERADAAWVHGREEDPRFRRLRNATISILGCGSVGAHVAQQLASAGVGRLLLIDPERLKWANVGRHPLGATAIPRGKAAALSEKLCADFPHTLGIDFVASRWEEADQAVLERLTSCDLIVSTIGDWAAESTLNMWHRTNRDGPIVYGWTEAHACAGHAVAIFRGGGCLQCGFTPAGAPLLPVTDWPEGPTVRREPGCGATYQPYGPVELGHIVSLIAETALDCLLGDIDRSLSRTWAARKALLDGVGGRWSSAWLAATGNRTDGGFIHERDWVTAAACIECKPIRP